MRLIEKLREESMLINNVPSQLYPATNTVVRAVVALLEKCQECSDFKLEAWWYGGCLLNEGPYLCECLKLFMDILLEGERGNDEKNGMANTQPHEV